MSQFGIQVLEPDANKFYSITCNPIIKDEQHQPITLYFRSEKECNKNAIMFLDNGYDVIKLIHGFSD